MKLDIGLKSLLNKHESPTIFFLGGWGRAHFRRILSVLGDRAYGRKSVSGYLFKKKDLDLIKAISIYHTSE